MASGRGTTTGIADGTRTRAGSGGARRRRRMVIGTGSGIEGRGKAGETR